MVSSSLSIKYMWKSNCTINFCLPFLYNCINRCVTWLYSHHCLSAVVFIAGPTTSIHPPPPTPMALLAYFARCLLIELPEPALLKEFIQSCSPAPPPPALNVSTHSLSLNGEWDQSEQGSQKYKGIEISCLMYRLMFNLLVFSMPCVHEQSSVISRAYSRYQLLC